MDNSAGPSDATILVSWLHEGPDRHPKFRNFSLQEFIEASPRDGDVESMLTRALVSTRVDPQLLAGFAKSLGWSGVRTWLVGKMPLVPNCRRGVFGEVLVGQVLQVIHRYVIPVWKDRFLVTRGQSSPGVDGLALKLQGTRLSEVCYYEVKLRTTLDREAAKQGYEQIRVEVDKPVPDLLSFVLARLHEQRSPLFDPLMSYLEDREYTGIDDTYRLGLVWEDREWDDSVLRALEARMQELSDQSLNVTLVKISGVRPLTTRIFSGVGVTELLDGD